MAENKKAHVVIIGAGPAGLAAGAELAESGYQVTILEKDLRYVGGIARTVQHNGYRFDIGGHRFFSKNPSISEWWRKRLPNDFLKVRRLSRIFYRGKYFNYPLKPMNAFLNLGFFESLRCLASYAFVKFFPIKPEVSFEDWVSNRFGKTLFSIFFKTYTEKVWGIPCSQISADWAAQRIRNLSITSAVLNAFRPKFLAKKKTIKTLIDEFEYPKLGPGMMWEKTRDDIEALGGKIIMGEEAISINHEAGKVFSITTKNLRGEKKEWRADFFIASCPLRETVGNMNPPLSQQSKEAAQRLCYRSFITVVLMIEKAPIFPDQWIYVHSPEVKLGRIQNFNNWSPFMVPASGTTCLGLEYFCNEGDDLWNSPDEALVKLGKSELQKIGLWDGEKITDFAVVRMPKTYPVYTLEYAKNVKIIRDELSSLCNFQIIGRNGMHKYDNQDHAMMTGFFAARNIMGEKLDLWRINADAEYIEDGEQES